MGMLPSSVQNKNLHLGSLWNSPKITILIILKFNGCFFSFKYNKGIFFAVVCLKLSTHFYSFGDKTAK